MKCAYAFATPYGVNGLGAVSSVCGVPRGSPKISLDEGLVEAHRRVDLANRLEHRGRSYGSELRRADRLVPRLRDERRGSEVVDLGRTGRLQSLHERRVVQEVARTSSIRVATSARLSAYSAGSRRTTRATS
jgi:hypothetical protein